MKRYLVEMSDADKDTIIRTTIAKRTIQEVIQYLLDRYHDHEMIATLTITELGEA